jgi:hypothetical protein
LTRWSMRRHNPNVAELGIRRLEEA